MMPYYFLPFVGLLSALIGATIALFGAHRHYKGRFKADKTAKILGYAEKRELLKAGETIVKLDFDSLLKDMELKYKLWGGKYATRIGIWQNWIKTLLNKEGNTK